MSPPARHFKIQNRHGYLLKGSTLVVRWTWDGPAFGGSGGSGSLFLGLWFYKAVWLGTALTAVLSQRTLSSHPNKPCPILWGASRGKQAGTGGPEIPGRADQNWVL